MIIRKIKRHTMTFLKTKNFPKIEYKIWQQTVLIFTSGLLLIVALWGIINNCFLMGIIGLISSSCSINYWYKPGLSWRLYLDFTFALISMIYYIITIIKYYNLYLFIYCIILFTLYILSNKISFEISIRNNDNWVYFHALGHCLVIVMALSIIDILNKIK